LDFLIPHNLRNAIFNGEGLRLRPAISVALAVAFIGLGIATVGVYTQSKRHTTSQGGDMVVNITTAPAGATIRINGEEKCPSGCRLSIPPGDYQVTALLEGYEASATVLTVKAGESPSLALGLQPQPQTVRVHTDLAQGNVKLDNQRETPLIDGQFILEKVAA